MKSVFPKQQAFKSKVSIKSFMRLHANYNVRKGIVRIVYLDVAEQIFRNITMPTFAGVELNT